MKSNEGFRWGAGASSVTIDGVAPASELAVWEHDGRHPPGPATGFGTSFPADLAELADKGLTQVRLTLEWARIEPSDGQVDVGAVEHLQTVLATARESGVSVWACLHDDTLPGWFAHDERGFGDPRSRRYYWARHVEQVGELFGHLVDGWLPVFEPTRWAYQGWITAQRPPGSTGDAKGFAQALEGVHLASVEAALCLRGSGRPVATAQWMVPLFPARPDPDTPAPAEAQAMTSVVDEALFGSWHRMLTEETLQVGHRGPVEVPGAREAFDLIGFTYRHGAAVRGDGVLLPYPQTLDLGPDGQVPWAHGFGLSLHHLADAFPEHPLLAVGVPTGDPDDRRAAETSREVAEIAQEAVADGIDLRGLWWNGPLAATPPAPA
ncbi:MAG: family 1 glycosylhydrolase [Aquihabitans sp.]